MYVSKDIIQLIYYTYYKHIVLQELNNRTNTLLYVMDTKLETRQIIYFEKSITENGNTRNYIIYDLNFKKCYSVHINPMWTCLEQTPTKSLKKIIFS